MNQIPLSNTSSSSEYGILKEWVIEEESELTGWGSYVVENIERSSLLLMVGAMGSGKTTMVRYLMKSLEGEKATSPTFSLVNEYRYPGGEIYHFDLYRMDEPEDLEEIGFEEYLDREALCIIEWPQLGTYFYQDKKVTTMQIEVLADGRRRIKWIKGFVR